ncbi:MAG: chromosome partitioning protein ParB, partial [Syntrophaceticus sp.]
DEFQLTQEEIALRVGKSRSFIANSLRLLQLPEKIQGLLVQGKLSVGHGKVLLGVPDPQQQLNLAMEIVEKNLTVREAEKAAMRLLKQKKEKPRKKEQDYELTDAEDRLRRLLGTKVKIKKGRKGGKIEIDFYSGDELDRLLELLFYLQS